MICPVTHLNSSVQLHYYDPVNVVYSVYSFDIFDSYVCNLKYQR